MELQAGDRLTDPGPICEWPDTAGDKKDLDDLFRARLDSRSLEAYEASEARDAYS